MAPFLCNGIYKIRNAQYPDLVADLLNGHPYGPIVGIKNRGSNRNDRWRLTNEGGGGNVIILENLSTGTFADAREFPGADLTGSHNRRQWTILKEDRGRYAIQTENGVLVWVLPQGNEYERIQLVPHTGQDNTRWYFDRIGSCK